MTGIPTDAHKAMTHGSICCVRLTFDNGCMLLHFIYPLPHLLGYVLLGKGSATQGSSQIPSTVISDLYIRFLKGAVKRDWATRGWNEVSQNGGRTLRSKPG